MACNYNLLFQVDKYLLVVWNTTNPSSLRTLARYLYHSLGDVLDHTVLCLACIPLLDLVRIQQVESHRFLGLFWHEQTHF